MLKILKISQKILLRRLGEKWLKEVGWSIRGGDRPSEMKGGREGEIESESRFLMLRDDDEL